MCCAFWDATVSSIYLILSHSLHEAIDGEKGSDTAPDATSPNHPPHRHHHPPNPIQPVLSHPIPSHLHRVIIRYRLAPTYPAPWPWTWTELREGRRRPCLAFCDSTANSLNPRGQTPGLHWFLFLLRAHSPAHPHPPTHSFSFIHSSLHTRDLSSLSFTYLPR
ncbi:hypothetical protein LX36DRAFT_66317 [Colletotrichum falcatum]|nr:hypothetical protein LX36DRAFT_66317 [Colletotrichum falcatum]